MPNGCVRATLFLCTAALLSVACATAQPAAMSRGDASKEIAVVSAKTLSAAERSCGLGGEALARAYGDSPTLVAAFSVSALQMAAWQERWPGPGPSGPHTATGTSAYRTHPSDEVLTLCWFDGAFVHFGHGPGPTGATRGLDATGPTGTAGPPQPDPVYERMVAVVDPAGVASLLAIGPRAGLAISDPTAP
jgi:hypothetical protein